MSMSPDMYRISVDLDNVTFDFDSHWRSAYCEHFEKPPVRRDDILWNGPIYNTHFDTYREWLDWIAEKGLWENCPMILGAEEGIQALIDYGFDVWFMTARTDHAAQATREWWHDSGWHQVTTLATDLHDKTEQNAMAYIDDRPKTLLQVDQTTDAFPVCFLQPWNDSAEKWLDDCEGFDPPAPSARVGIARDWDTVVKLIVNDYETLYQT